APEVLERDRRGGGRRGGAAQSHPHADYCGWSAGAGEASMALILQTLSPDRRMGALANGQQVVKSFRYHLTDSRQFDILQSGHGWRGSNAIRSIETARVHHASLRPGGRLAARGTGAAAGPGTADRRAHQYGG